MRTKETSFVGFMKTIPKNMFSGLVVSLIALPLSLGLAMASDAPPIARFGHSRNKHKQK